MAIRKSDDIANEGSKFANLKGTNSVAKITDRFDDTTHNEHVSDFALQYLNKKLDDVIDETNKGTTASGSYASDVKILKTSSGSFSTRVTANDAKTGISSAQSVQIAAHNTIVNKTQGTLTLSISNNNLVVVSVVGRDKRTYVIEPQG